MKEKRIKEELHKLIQYIFEIIDKFPKTRLKPAKIRCFRWKLDKFEYTEKGFVSKSASGEYFDKETWFIVAENIYKKIEKSTKYKKFTSTISNFADKKENLEYAISSLVRLVIRRHLEGGIKKSEINYLIRIFIADLKNEPIECWAVVNIDGIALGFEKLILTPNIKIRRPSRKDFEKEISVDFFPMHSNYHLQNISAVLKITLKTISGRELQEYIGKVIAILRLFRVGSVMYTSFRMYADSPSRFFGGEHSSIHHKIPEEYYFVKFKEKNKLKEFFRKIENKIPNSFYGFGGEKTDYITIAYKRYCDALLEGGLIEKRIMNIMMGLEALFITENQEVGYRLRIRLSKFLFYLGLNPQTIKNKIKDAYSIRSLFSHGSVLDYKARKKYESKYGNIKDFVRELLDHLRLALIFSIVIDLEKNQFVDLIDNALIDKKQDEILERRINEVKSLLTNN